MFIEIPIFDLPIYQCRWLVKRGIKTGGEKGIRAMQSEIIDGNLEAMMIPLQQWSEIEHSLEIVCKPLIIVGNLNAKIQQLLDQYAE